ncbi:hypothetical protein A3H85_02630 [Candidatus Daviesbacteria bacterium RIFCSPLOWO2_02_FULL_40_8]|uniref:Uncharacterized protein n=1 Tax=Candidatus Daviesbacteria bacterium RIFCSPLOWO2_01_FULL_40_24 TaxID=1797787 RepID=A0A1F5MIJ2_9BACT|nr:MAG: hypothetical protein A2780_03360 [Candidatus Daviesbacteria bacterium RIFCSPHIGHO2_01_FULL_41_45]OGE34184.1 MAG: hypothetical protein A3C32_00445 [Candidatus Daviesbacteria bacterium RIFCSPHIGHO2_02_FULL_41_14]OGE65168.1 MAG: hypothetical protein A3B49_01395 [Candidatus Daviesbacteria bacterium RIFCSPLOWO2_01_FULL_40_24]OGE66871.1 MAG: hypothetical protein A3H85_02630 [Candidatus Daviesbacteria bacterium RIFCSPLOWO2_02_FULL_40_8]
MLNAQAFANALTTVILGVYIVCRVASLIAPDFLFNVAKSWFHTLSVDSLKGTAPMDTGMFLFGAITLAVLVWVTTYATVSLYNKWAK